MGFRGPLGRTSAVKALRGNPGKRALPPPSTAYDFKLIDPDHLPKPPLGFSSVAAAEFTKVCGLLARGQVLTKADVRLIEVYARTYAIWLTASETLEREGVTVVTIDDKRCKVESRPEVKICQQAASSLLKLSQELGLSPGSRARLRSRVPETLNEAMETAPDESDLD